MDDGRWIHTWDAGNRLVRMQSKSSAVAAGAPNQAIDYTYDFRSRRIGRKCVTTAGSSSTTTETRCLHDGWNCVAEFPPLETGSLKLDTPYVWPVDLSSTLQGAGGVGGLLSVRLITGSQRDITLLPAYDANGSIIAWSDTAGRVARRQDYDPFGNLVIRERGSLPAAAAKRLAYGFSTKPPGPDTGLHYYGYRWYPAPDGRWRSKDPIGERGGMNVYGFVKNGPVAFVDIIGLLEFPPPQFEFPLDLQKLESRIVEGQAVDQIDYAFYGLLETDKNAARFAKLIHKDAKEFAGFKDLVDHIAQTQPRCSCIRTLNLVTHGAMLKDGGVALHPGGRKYSSRNHGEEFGSALKDAMCSPCQINIYGCTAGAGSALFVEGLRSRTGCSIVAHATALMALGVKEGIPERRTGFGKVAATPDVAVWETADQKPPTVWPAKGGGPVQMNPPPILRDRGFSVSKLTMNSKHNRVGLLLNSLLLAGSLGACVPGLRFLLEWRAQRTIDRELCELESLKGTFIDRSTFRSSYGAPRFPVTELDFIGHGNPDRAMFNVTSLLQCRSANLYLDPDDRVEFVGRPRTTSYVTIDMSPIYVGIVEDRKFGPFSRLERLGLEFVIVALGIGFVLACKHVTLRKLRRVQ